jgi:hypothetical protein
MRGISWLAGNLLASQEALCSMEKVSKCYYYMTRYISMTIIGIRTVHKETWQSVFAQLHFDIWKETGVKLNNET